MNEEAIRTLEHLLLTMDRAEICEALDRLPDDRLQLAWECAEATSFEGGWLGTRTGTVADRAEQRADETVRPDPEGRLPAIDPGRYRRDVN